ncbi:MAG: PLD nuclease N-terminal domain-containing protein [Lentisphaerae bacterium]|nr:PLD nuclease N-terminal domain-containing protein [Lentisphaerota bacterium]
MSASLVAVPMFLVFLVLGVGGTILWIWMIIDCATREKSEGNDKLIWILIIVLTHWIGARIYLLVRRPKRIGLERAAAK